MPAKVFRGRVEKGQLKMDREAVRKHLHSFKEGVDIAVTFKPFKKPRSNNQNRYYWGVVIDLISSELGYFPQEAHEALKWQFLKVEGEVLPTVKGTSDLATDEFEKFLDAVRAWAALELSIYIPLPHETEFNY
jgi:hypothetical protein